METCQISRCCCCVKTWFKQEFIEGWKVFEWAWLGLFVLAQVVIYIIEPDSVLGMVAGIAGIVCNVLITKGKISNYFFGLIFAYSYFYVAWGNNFLGEMNTTLYVYIPAQFIGYFLWKENMQKQAGAEVVKTQALSLKGWGIMLLILAVGTLILRQILIYKGGDSAGLDGLTTVIVVVAQTLMLLRYREQWLLWILLNILSLFLWENSLSMQVMYSAYLLNSLYGYYNWTRLQKSAL